MIGCATRMACADDAAAILALGVASPCADFTFYRRYGHDFAVDYLSFELRRFLRESDAVAVVATAGDEIIGFAGARPSPWESGHFAIPMATSAFLLSAARAERAATVTALLPAIERLLLDRGVAMLTMRIDASDLAAHRAVQGRGYFHADTMLTHLLEAYPAPCRYPHIDPAYVATSYAPDRFHEVDRDELAPLSDFMSKAFRTDRYHADPRLPVARSDALYAEWFRNAFEGAWADGIHIVRKHGRLVGFCCFKQLKDVLDRYGVNIVGRYVTCALPDGRGGAMSCLVDACYRSCPCGSAFSEYDMVVQNLPAINTAINHGCHLVRTRYTYHCWLRPARRRRRSS
ncbi:MAG: hypothetical protein HYV63_10475 [Candidatus Schekmanbacteria bacterium]|nr:hypothetical protein [Candidatus Schekmanbacteria bacterium]